MCHIYKLVFNGLILLSTQDGGRYLEFEYVLGWFCSLPWLCPSNGLTVKSFIKVDE